MLTAPARLLARLLARPRAPFVAALLGQAVFAGSVKDDAYIEFRYALNLAGGHGLVFNRGDPPVEGITGFLWTVALAIPARLGINLLVAAKLAGAAAVLGIVLAVGRWVRQRSGDESAVLRARWLAASSGSIIVWGQSGMEMVVAAWLVVCGVAAFERRTAAALAAGLALMALAAGVRPEVHLLVGLAALLAIGRALSQPRARAGAAAGLALAATILAAMHLTRFAIYHSLVPNTALVKAATFSLRAGLRFVGELLMTGLIGVPLVLAFAEARRRRDDVALLCAGGLALFALYLVRIGNDEMSLARLYLPVLPLAFGLAACRLSAGAAAPRGREPLVDRAGILVAIVCGAGVLSACFHLQAAGAISRGNRSNAPLARALHRFGRPGDLVVFQDLGRTPYEAMELRFVDPIGLVDREIAHILYRDGAMPFLRAPSPAAQRQIRDRLFALRPRFVVLVAYVAKPDTVEVARRFHAAERQGLLDPWFSGNYYHAGLYDDPRFRRGYQFIDAWQRNVEYYMALYQARPDEPD